MSKKLRASRSKGGTVIIDPPPAPLTLLTSGDEKREDAAQEAQAQWDAKFRGSVLAGTINHAVEQWREVGLDPGAVIRAIVDGKDPVLADAVIALTKRPQIHVRKPRQGKSKWTAKEQGELILAVWNRREKATILHGPKVTITKACADLVGRQGPKKWRGISSEGLQARYREALKSPVGQVLDYLLSTAEEARSAGRIKADEFSKLFGNLDRFVASL